MEAVILRLPSHEKRALQQIARSNVRSVNAQLRYLLRREAEALGLRVDEPAEEDREQPEPAAA